MADISITKNHQIDTDALRPRLEELAADLKRKYGVKHSWNGDVCTLSGTGIKNGTVVLNESTVVIEVTLGMLGRALKGKIEEEIEKKINRVLDI